MTACGTPPKVMDTSIQSASNKVVKTPVEALMRSSEKIAEWKFTSLDPLLKIGIRNAPFKVIEFEISDASKSYAVFSSRYRNIDIGKQAIVVPTVYFFDENKAPVKAVLAQMADDPFCGFFRCFKTTYKIDAQPGKYLVVVAAYVEDPEKPVQSITDFSPAVESYGAASVSVKFYADYYGSLSLSLDSKLPRPKQ